MSVASDAYVNNLETQRGVLADYEQVFSRMWAAGPLKPISRERRREWLG